MDLQWPSVDLSWFEVEREREYISSQDSIHIFNHGLVFLSNLWSNMINTDLLPVAPVLLLVVCFLQLGSSSQCQITIVGANSTEHQ